MGSFIDLVGKKYGRLTVIRRTTNNPSGRVRWICRCDCGNEVVTVGHELKSGDTKSCGCLTSEWVRQMSKLYRVKHGMYGTYQHSILHGMMLRCYDPNCKSYKYYGGRGIQICEFLKSNPRNLTEVIGERPSYKRFEFTIDRIDNDAHYSCGVCPECLQNGWTKNIRWANQKEQHANRRL